MIAPVKFSWCQVMEFIALADESGGFDAGKEVMWEALAVLGACNVGACMVLPSKRPGELIAPLSLHPLSFLEILHLSSWLGGKRRS